MTTSNVDTGRLLGHFAHDLRTPLATIFGFAKTIERRTPLDEQQARYLAIISEAALDLERIISMLALTGRVLRGALEPQLARVSTRTLVSDTVTAIRDTRGELAVTAKPGVDGIVNADHDLVVEALSLVAMLPLRLDPSLGEAELEPLSDGVRIGPVTSDLAAVLAAASTDVALETARLMLGVTGGRVEPEPAALRVCFAT